MPRRTGDKPPSLVNLGWPRRHPEGQLSVLGWWGCVGATRPGRPPVGSRGAGVGGGGGGVGMFGRRPAGEERAPERKASDRTGAPKKRMRVVVVVVVVVTRPCRIVPNSALLEGGPKSRAPGPATSPARTRGRPARAVHNRGARIGRAGPGATVHESAAPAQTKGPPLAKGGALSRRPCFGERLHPSKGCRHYGPPRPQRGVKIGTAPTTRRSRIFHGGPGRMTDPGQIERPNRRRKTHLL